MSTITKPNTKETNEVAQAANEQAARVASHREVIAKEYGAILASDRAHQELMGKIGSDVRTMLAVDCGQSVKTKMGRPEVGPSRRLDNAISAMGKDDKTFKEQARLYVVSQNAIGTSEDNKLSAIDIAEAKKKHVVSTGKSLDGKANATVRMARPLAIAIAFGE